jgi:hypothetical protein
VGAARSASLGWLRGSSYGPFESPGTVGTNPTARNKRFYGACVLGAFVGPNVLSFDTLLWYTGDHNRASAKFKIFWSAQVVGACEDRGFRGP